MTAYSWLRKARGGVWGPWHLREDGSWLTLCGRRVPGVTHRTHDDPPPEDRRCEKCERNLIAGRRTPYSRR